MASAVFAAAAWLPASRAAPQPDTAGLLASSFSLPAAWSFASKPAPPLAGAAASEAAAAASKPEVGGA